MNRLRAILIIQAVVAAILLSGHRAMAQKFSVSGFRMLPNDVTAFIDPVKDLNDEDCALIKVLAGPDFAFSTPLGIIRRVDNTGEIWLYIPRNSKKITLKHPQWGVLRDYRFPVKIDSHITYELKIDEPLSIPLMAEAMPQITTLRDTVVITHTDTLVIKPVRKTYPLTLTAVAGAVYGGTAGTFAPGVFVAAMKRHGAFVHLMSDFGRVGTTSGACDREGMIDGRIPYYSGRKRHSFLMVNAGAAHRISNFFTIFEGLGYGTGTVAWQLADSEGGGYVRNDHYSCKGLSMEAGIMVNIRKFRIMTSVATIKGSQWYGSVGIGITIGK